MKYNLDILNDYIDAGLVLKQDHPTLPISIYNYSRKTQYEGKWDEITLNCRGLILDFQGKVVAKTFPKFFNYEELVGSKWKLSEIPNEPFEVFEKLDGSLGIFFYYEEQWIMATKGSFISEQSVKGMQIAKKYLYDKTCIPGFTYLFEIIYPENRIVCDYGKDERLVLLSIMNRNGIELPYDMIEQDGWDIVRRYDGISDFKVLKEMISKDREGFVVRFQNGMRMKIKGDEYVRLHKILTQVSSYDIWEYLKEGKDIMEIVEKVPDEFDKWVKLKVSEISYNHFRISEYCGKLHDYFRYGKYNDKPEPTKKEYAEHVKNNINPNLHGVMFAIWDGGNKKADDIIWKLVKPKHDKPFSKIESE